MIDYDRMEEDRKRFEREMAEYRARHQRPESAGRKFLMYLIPIAFLILLGWLCATYESPPDYEQPAAPDGWAF